MSSDYVERLVKYINELEEEGRRSLNHRGELMLKMQRMEQELRRLVVRLQHFEMAVAANLPNHPLAKSVAR